MIFFNPMIFPVAFCEFFVSYFPVLLGKFPDSIFLFIRHAGSREEPPLGGGDFL
jgi:hypothetical protein